ncbi:hypothetical protein SBADM41S_10663 [Streptomyces badius]
MAKGRLDFDAVVAGRGHHRDGQHDVHEAAGVIGWADGLSGALTVTYTGGTMGEALRYPGRRLLTPPARDEQGRICSSRIRSRCSHQEAKDRWSSLCLVEEDGDRRFR